MGSVYCITLIVGRSKCQTIRFYNAFLYELTG